MKVWKPKTRRNRDQHILNASTSLLGICFVILTAISALKLGPSTYADEITIGASGLFLLSILLSYISIRIERDFSIYEDIADYCFMVGLVMLSFGVFIFSRGIM